MSAAQASRDMGGDLIGASMENELGEMRRQLRMGADVNYLDSITVEGVDIGLSPLT